MNDRLPALRLLTRAARPRIMVPLLLLALAVYFAFLHPWLMNWGTTAQEQQMTLPGDEMLPHPGLQFTRAITINAPASAVWPWVAQIGQDRAGFYSYDWLENLVGADIHNQNAIRPAWQALAPGDGFNMASPHYLGGAAGEFSVQRIVAIAPGRAIVMKGGLLSYALQPVDDHTTRLLVRERSGVAENPLLQLTWDPTHLVMQRQMLRGIMARAEGHPNPPALLDLPARIGWLIGGIALGALFLRQGTRRRLWLLLPLAATIPALVYARDMDAALAAFLAVGIATLGALTFGRRWWAPFMNLAAVVLLVLLLAPDAYLAFGWTFALLPLVAVVIAYGVRRMDALVQSRPLVHRAA